MLDSILQKDKELLIFLNNLGSEQWDSFWLIITNQFSWTPLFLFMFYLILKTFGWKKGGFVIVSLIILVAFSDIFVNLIKDSVQRLRPNNDPEIQHLLRHLKNPQSFSFISGHATTSTFFSIFMILVFREKYKYIYLILFFPLIFAYSRLYLGVHYPIDIFLGLLTGVILANGYYFLFNKVDKKLFKKN